MCVVCPGPAILDAFGHAAKQCMLPLYMYTLYYPGSRNDAVLQLRGVHKNFFFLFLQRRVPLQ